MLLGFFLRLFVDVLSVIVVDVLSVFFVDVLYVIVVVDVLSADETMAGFKPLRSTHRTKLIQAQLCPPQYSSHPLMLVSSHCAVLIH